MGLESTKIRCSMYQILGIGLKVVDGRLEISKWLAHLFECNTLDWCLVRVQNGKKLQIRHCKDLEMECAMRGA